MDTLRITDLSLAVELEREELAAIDGGRGRTPPQILAWEITGKPATWQGLVLEDDGTLSVPVI